MINKAMQSRLEAGDAIDVEEAGFLLDPEKQIWQLGHFVDGKDYCVRRTEQWIWSIGRHHETNKIFASTATVYYQNPGFECLFLR